MWLDHGLYRIFLIIKAKLTKSELALVDEGDPDGIVSGALFKMRFPRGVVVTAYPPEIKSNYLIRAIRWDFVADLPCPGKARLRADHHLSNTPCAAVEFYDPNAPASALLALKALGLEENPTASKLVSLAVETDTAQITSQEAMDLEAAVKGADFKGKLHLIEVLAKKGVDALNDEKVKEYIERYRKNKSRTEEFAALLQPPPKEVIVFFKKDYKLSYRYLTILLEKSGADFTFILVPKGLFRYRVYAGAKPESSYNAASIVEPLGGGGHKFAAGATFRSISSANALKKVLPLLKQALGRDSIDIIVVEDDGLKKTTLS